MNADQQARYLGCWTETSRPLLRTFTCVHCRFSANARAGKGSGNALASVAKLRGKMMTHIREHHPDQIQENA